ncbi:MAG: PAN/Apple domain-containing protein, partial [Parvibaculaceae bacterium]
VSVQATGGAGMRFLREMVSGRSPRNLAIGLTLAACSLGLAADAVPDEVTTGIQMAQAAASDIKRVRQVDLYGVNFPGMPIAAGSADDCEAHCAVRAGCAAFTFHTGRSACFLKASAEIAVSHPRAISGYRGRLEKRIRRIALTIREATDYPGNDIDRRRATSFETCLLACGKARTCRAFTYVVRRQECWLKNGTGSAEPRNGVVSGVK